jgi:5S rRNA maturation endonuclease (ribonuclease M5)
LSYINVAERYLKLKKQGKNYFALCPFHEEKTPSLSINPDNGLWYCWGCGQKGNIYHLIEKMESVKFPEAVEIAKSYGVDPPDNFKEKPAFKNDKDNGGRFADKEYNAACKADNEVNYMETKNEKEPDYETQEEEYYNPEADVTEEILPPPQAPVYNADKPVKPPVKKQAAPVKDKDKEFDKKTAVYIYDDENGKILYEKERWERFKGEERISKKFLFYHYEGAKRLTGKGNAKLILYNLKDVLLAENVFICEGEKDCDNLKALWPDKNAAFTTNATGAESWEDSYNTFLKGKNITVFEDNDEAGRKRTEKLTAALSKVAKSFKVVKFDELEEHGDVSDYLKDHSLDELIDKIREEERTADNNANKTAVVVFEAREMKFFIDKTDYLFPDFMPLKKGDINTVSGATLEFLIYLTLLFSKKLNAVFLSNYNLDSLFPHFANVAKRMTQKDRTNIKDIKAGNLNAEIGDADIIISTAYKDKKGITVICPQSENRLPDFYFKNGDIYDKFWKKVLRIENLRGAGEIKLSVIEREKRKSKSLLDSIFKKK